MTDGDTRIPILHEDESLVVVDKPAGCLVVAAPGRSGPTLVDLVGRQLGRRVYAVHRLDEDTTGLLVLARTETARAAMEELFRRHAVERVYVALLSRAPSPNAGRIESRLAESGDGVVRSVTRGGEKAVTHYRLLARRGPFALVECRLETGRRNQIRAHMSELGCPIVGDRKYGFRGRGPWRRPLLHARRLTFQHPVDGVAIDVVCEAGAPELRVD